MTERARDIGELKAVIWRLEKNVPVIWDKAREAFERLAKAAADGELDADRR